MTKQVNKNFRLGGVGFWGIAILTIIIAIAILLGTPISPWWMLAPIALPIVCAIILPIILILLVAGALILVTVCAIIAIPPLVILALCFCSSDFEEDTKEES